MYIDSMHCMTSMQWIEAAFAQRTSECERLCLFIKATSLLYAGTQQLSTAASQASIQNYPFRVREGKDGLPTYHGALLLTCPSADNCIRDLCAAEKVRFHTVKAAISEAGYSQSGDASNAVREGGREKTYAPEQISALVLEELKTAAQSHFGDRVEVCNVRPGLSVYILPVLIGLEMCLC